MVVSPALQRGERGQQEPVSPVGAAQNSELSIKITFMRLPWPQMPDPFGKPMCASQPLTSTEKKGGPGESPVRLWTFPIPWSLVPLFRRRRVQQLRSQ
jgi:hypothetical protein